MGRVAFTFRGEGRRGSIAESRASLNQIPEIMESPEFHDLPFAKLPLKKPCNNLISTRRLRCPSSLAKSRNLKGAERKYECNFVVPSRCGSILSLWNRSFVWISNFLAIFCGRSGRFPGNARCTFYRTGRKSELRRIPPWV